MTTFKNQGIVIHEDISDVGISLTKDISLESLQAAVGGYIEPIVQHRFADVTVFANEEGLLKNLPPNTAATIIFEYPLVGNVVMVADDDEMNKEFEHEADEADDARVPYLHPLGTLAKLDDETDNVLSPLDDMMDRHRERLDSKGDGSPVYDDIDCHPNYDPKTDTIKGDEPPVFYERLDNYDPAGH